MKFLKGLFFTLIFLLFVCALFYKFWFLRLPEREAVNDNHKFLSPANGVVVSITNWNKSSLEITKGNFGLINTWAQDVDTAGILVSIQMDPTHVHYQRLPVDAKLVSEKFSPGLFKNALLSDNPYGIRFENEHNEMLFETGENKRFKIVQIAGFVARRIEDYVEQNKNYKQEDVIGLIKLGSQISVLLPHGTKINAKIGETVIEGKTILADF